MIITLSNLMDQETQNLWNSLSVLKFIMAGNLRANYKAKVLGKNGYQLSTKSLLHKMWNRSMSLNHE